MTPDTLASTAVGLGVTAREAATIAAERRRGDSRYADIGFLNIGLDPGEAVAVGLKEALSAADLWTVLHAVDLNLSSNPAESRVAALGEAAEALAPRWIEEDLGTWVWANAYLGAHQLECCLTREEAEQTALVVQKLTSTLRRPFLVENPPVYLAMGEHDMWTHLGLVADAADCGLVIDVGHMIGAHVNGDVPMRVAGAEWPGWRRVREVHFSGFELRRAYGRWLWQDRHDLPFCDLLMEWGEVILKAVRCPVAVTLELDGATADVVDENLRKILELVRAGATLPA